MSPARQRALESLGVFLVATACVLPSLRTWPDHFSGDENGFVEHGMTLTRAFAVGLARGDFSDPVWEARLDNYGCYNPRVGAYLLGALGHATDTLESDRRVRIMRTVVAVCSAACVALLFTLVRINGSFVSGVFAAALLLLHPAFRCLQAALLPDVPMALFSLAALIFVVAYWGSSEERPKQARPTVGNPALLIGFGLFAGLAISCKLYAGALLVMWPLIVSRSRPRLRRVLPWILGAFALMVAVFFASNPLLYSHPILGVRTMTAGHMAEWVGDAPAFDPRSLIRATDALFGLFVPLHVDVRTDLQVLNGLHVLPWSSYLGALLFTIGVGIAVMRRNSVALAWAVSAFALIGYVLAQFPSEVAWAHPRMLILPAFALIWLIAGIDLAALRPVANALRGRGRLTTLSPLFILGFVNCSHGPSETVTAPPPVRPSSGSIRRLLVLGNGALLSSCPSRSTRAIRSG